METIKIKISTANQILEYLAAQPFKDVANLISIIQKEVAELNANKKEVEDNEQSSN